MYSKPSATLLDFNTLLQMANLDSAEALIVRHAPSEKPLKRVMPWLVVERPDLWLAYQSIQWHTLEKAMTRARYVASFVGQESAAATFAGIYRIGPWQTLDFEGYNTFPGNRELSALGMSGRTQDMPDCLAFDLEPLDYYQEWVGKLVVAWPTPYQQWWRWGGRKSIPVKAIESESRFVQGMPDWKGVILTWHELQSLPQSWQNTLAQWRGIYLIFDTVRNAGYVGSACGAENILGRWRNYALNGHGDNVELRRSNPSNLRFSILQLTAQDLDASELFALETSWKERLHTRKHGLNRN